MKNHVIHESMVQVPLSEYNLLKEIYKTYKRQKFLFRIDEAENNLQKNKVKKIKIDEFIDNIK